MKIRDKYLSEGTYKVARNPQDKMWYVVGKVGKHWMPVSDGKKSKKEAEKYMKGQELADDDMRKHLLENNIVINLKDKKKEKKQKQKELAKKEIDLCNKMMEYIGYYRDGLMDKKSLQRTLDKSMKELR